MKAKALFVTDLDGTLYFREQGIGEADKKAFEQMGTNEVIRVIATGRALQSVVKVVPDNFPVDYLLYCSGAGILRWKTKEVLRTHIMDAEQVGRAAKVFTQRDWDFMIHDPVPNNHRFRFHRSKRENPDFERRFKLHQEHGTPLKTEEPSRPATQVISVLEGTDSPSFEKLRKELSPLSVLRVTSPLDSLSTWIEVLAPGVSKASGVQWIAERHGLKPRDVWAIGNDYNDEDLLRWAGKAAVMPGSPAPLTEEFETIKAERGSAVSRFAQTLPK